MRASVLRLLLVMVCVTTVAGPATAGWRWGIGFGGGYADAGTAYRASTDRTAPPPVWELPDGSGNVAGEEIRVQVDGAWSFGARLTLQSEGRLGAVLSAMFTQFDVPAVRRTLSDNVEPVPWDQWFATNVSAVATWAFLPQGRTGYLLGGVSLTSFSSEGTALDATRPALVLGGGVRTGFGRLGMLSLEVRDTIVPLSLDDEEARLGADDVVFEKESVLHLLETQASVSLFF